MGFQFGAAVADDDAYQTALQRREVIQAELQRLQKELVDIEEFVSLYQRLFRRESDQGGVDDEDLIVARSSKRNRNLLSPARIAEMARDIISQHGAPMTRTQLLGAIQARGIPLAGRDPSKNLGTIMWRHQDLFISVPGLGYWLKDVPLPTARSRDRPRPSGDE